MRPINRFAAALLLCSITGGIPREAEAHGGGGHGSSSGGHHGHHYVGGSGGRHSFGNGWSTRTPVNQTPVVLNPDDLPAARFHRYVDHLLGRAPRW
jgi:hypothetical protein